MRRTLIAIVSTVVGLVMLLSFKTHGSRPGRLAALGNGGTSAATAPVTPKPADAGPSPATAAARRTIDGQAFDTQYGPVQLRVTFQGSRIAGIVPLQLPSGQSRDQEINSYAVPILNQEALKAQSAQIDTVSGATYTSDGYAQSLQSAIDQAHA